MFVKNHINRKIVSLAVMMALACVMLASPMVAFAAGADDNHIVITGDAQDFRIESGGTTLFDIEKMLPGEKAQFSDLTITNTQSLPYTLSIGVEDVGSYSDLLDSLDIVVRLNGNVIAGFPAKGQPDGAVYQNVYPFGRIPAQATAIIEVGLQFANGAAASNDLQGKGAQLVWRLTAVSDQPAADPGTGSPPGSNLNAFGNPAAASTVATADPSMAQNLPDLVNIGDSKTPSTTNESGDDEGCPCWFCPWCNHIIVILAVLCILFLVLWLRERRLRKRAEGDAAEDDVTATSI